MSPKNSFTTPAKGDASRPKRIQVLQMFATGAPGGLITLPNKNQVSFQLTFERALFETKPKHALLYFRDRSGFDGGAEVKPTPDQPYHAVVTQRPDPYHRKGMRVKLALQSGTCLSVFGKTVIGKTHSSVSFYAAEVLANGGSMDYEMTDKNDKVVGVVHVECQLN
mmetsp:Transcript_119737/g.168540  ORF Transcript_119737/g.168540 Transcript_119737/m.168540 type:complete len:166 (+) Transcript_119737:330-827(+)